MHISRTYYSNYNIKHRAKFLALESDPKYVASYWFTLTSGFANYFWATGKRRKNLSQNTEMRLNQSQTFHISKVIRIGHEWSLTYLGRHKPHVTLGSELVLCSFFQLWTNSKKLKGDKTVSITFSPGLSSLCGLLCYFANSVLLKSL